MTLDFQEHNVPYVAVKSNNINNDRPLRPYFCGNCGFTKDSHGYPIGWYRLQQCDGTQYLHNIGLYCSLICVAGMAVKNLLHLRFVGQR